MENKEKFQFTYSAKEQEEIKRKNDQRLPGRKTTTQETGKDKKGNKKK